MRAQGFPSVNQFCVLLELSEVLEFDLPLGFLLLRQNVCPPLPGGSFPNCASHEKSAGTWEVEAVSPSLAWRLGSLCSLCSVSQAWSPLLGLGSHFKGFLRLLRALYF